MAKQQAHEARVKELEQRMPKRVTVITCPDSRNIDVKASKTIGECKAIVAEEFGWPAGRIQLQNSMGELQLDDSEILFGGSFVATLSPWPVTVIVRLPTRASSVDPTVNLKLHIYLMSRGKATVAFLKLQVARLTGLAPLLFEVAQLQQANATPLSSQSDILKDDADLESLGIRSVVCRLRPCVKRVAVELMRLNSLWFASKRSQRPPPQEAWIQVDDCDERKAFDEAMKASAGGSPEEETLAFLRALFSDGATSEDQSLFLKFRDPEDGKNALSGTFRFEVRLTMKGGPTYAPKGEVFALELVVPADYPAHPPSARFEDRTQRKGLGLNGEVPNLHVCDIWESGNTLLCYLGELHQMLSLPDFAIEADPGRSLQELYNSAKNQS
eukprot:TRINITY_DN4329_c3_g1_i1.p1 TRINITY_DN4329_c3_g1~~TRINITY_DN4329_c3_g1_i1.p1  ORF type:complete len:428 (-),score=64.59 TRINITY_DN4329_c3_g1_i1:41-1195(-)